MHMNPSQFNRITKLIWQKKLIAISIPEREYSVKASIDISVYFNNNSIFYRHLNPAKSFLPEITTSHRQVLKALLATDKSRKKIQKNWLSTNYSKITRFFRERHLYLVPAKDAMGISTNAKIFWQEDKLNIQFHLDDFYPFNPKPYCSIENIIPGKYRFRFNYLNTAKAFNRNSRPIATNDKEFYLLKPVESNPNAVEIDEIQIETILSQTSVIIPHKENDIETPVSVGMKILNKTQSAFRFDFYNTLIPQMIKEDGQIIRILLGSNQLLSCTEAHYPLANPGEFVTFFPNAKLFWFNGELCLKIAIECGGFYCFRNLQSGEYLIRFVYRKSNNLIKMRNKHNQNNYIKPLQWLDRTIIATPYVKLGLRAEFTIG